MKLKLFVRIITLIFIAASCTAPKVTYTVNTIPIADADSSFRTAHVYYLPRTVLRIQVRLTRVSTLAGPYHEYADKYLGIKDVPHTDSQEWFVSGISVTSTEEPDPEQYYMLKSSDNNVSEEMLDAYRAKGIFFYRHSGIPFISAPADTRPGPLMETSVFTDLSIEDNQTIDIDTLYKTILTDSNFIRVPVYRKAEVSKSTSERAKEASDFLIKVRKNRFNLLRHEDGSYPSGPALEVGVRELTRLEAEYESLFTGKIFSDTLSLNYLYLPGNDESSENIKLFEFSKQEGPAARPGTGKIVSLMIRKSEQSANLERLSAESQKQNRNVLYYRIPDISQLEIQIDGIPLLRDRIPICQYGSVVSTPLIF